MTARKPRKGHDGFATSKLEGAEAKLVKRVKKLVRPFARDTQRASALVEAGRERFEHESVLVDLMAVGVLSLHLKQAEAFEDLIDAVRKLHAASASILCRPLLEDATTSIWLYTADTRPEQDERVLRLLFEEYRARQETIETLRDKKDTDEGLVLRPTPLTSAQELAMTEAKKRGLARLPKVRARMRDIDRRERKADRAPFIESHYRNFSLLSDVSHTSRIGPERLIERDGGVMIFTQGNELLRMNALRHGIYYFTSGYSALTALVGLEEESAWIRAQYEGLKPLIEEAEQIALERDETLKDTPKEASS